MDKHEKARKLLLEMQACRVKAFDHIDENLRGMMCSLFYLRYTEGEVIAGDLARELGVSAPRIACLLKKMEKRQLITRRPSARDARRTVVEITPEGVSWVESSEAKSLELMELLLDKVGQEDLDELIRISYKIKAAFGE